MSHTQTQKDTSRSIEQVKFNLDSQIVKREIITDNEENVIDDTESDVKNGVVKNEELYTSCSYTGHFLCVETIYDVGAETNHEPKNDCAQRIYKYLRNSQATSPKPPADEKKYKCSVCPSQYRHARSLRHHKLLHTGSKPFICEQCNKKFSRVNDLERHNRTHTGEKPHICLICDKGFSQGGSLKVHLRTHTGERPHKCTICQRGFSDGSHLQAHIRTHTGEKPFACTHCTHRFKRTDHLKGHMLNIHKIGNPCKSRQPHQRKFKCDVCPKEYMYAFDLNRHKRLHSGEGLLSCTRCDRKFRCASEMERHARIHTGERPFVCNICGRGFAQAGGLKGHQRIHTGERPHNCNKSFTSTSHSRVHTGEKPYFCSPSTLRKHVNTEHDGGFDDVPVKQESTEV